MEERENQAEVEAGENTGVSVENAVELARDQLNFLSKQADAGMEIGGKLVDYFTTVDNNRVRMAEVFQRAQDSEEAYNLAKDQLRLMENTLKENFVERRMEIEKEFSLIDKALEAGNWDAVVGLFDSGSKMVASSPLEGITERKNKLIKQRRSITSFDDV
jgi:hypothetical protein